MVGSPRLRFPELSGSHPSSEEDFVAVQFTCLLRRRRNHRIAGAGDEVVAH